MYLHDIDRIKVDIYEEGKRPLFSDLYILVYFVY